MAVTEPVDTEHDSDFGELEENDNEVAHRDDWGAKEAEQLSQRREEDIAKGRAAINQRYLWERGLEARVLLQKALESAHQFPRGLAWRGAETVSPAVAEAAHGARQTTRAIISDMQALRETLVELGGAAERQEGTGTKRKRSSGVTSKDIAGLGTQEMWEEMEQGYQCFAKYRDESLDAWYKRSQGGQTGLQQLGQGVARQVEFALTSGRRVKEKCRLPARLLPRRLAEKQGTSHVPVQPEEAVEKGGRETRSSSSLKNEERDAETYDDGDFYQELLKEFLESTGDDEFARRAEQTRSKRRKHFEAKNTRERKLRYTVHPDIVNFAVPQPCQPVAIARHLFPHLFGNYDPSNAAGLPAGPGEGEDE